MILIEIKMTPKLVIATKNRSKYQSVKSLIALTAGDLRINISQIDSKVPSAVENGRSSYKNVLIKAKHYSNYLRSPYVVIDDDIKLLNAMGNVFVHKLQVTGNISTPSAKELFYLMQKMLKENKPMTMVRTRYFIFVNQGKYHRMSSRFQSSLVPLGQEEFDKLRSDKIEENTLNYFSSLPDIPEKLYELTSQERSLRVYSNQIRNRIRSNLGSIFSK